MRFIKQSFIVGVSAGIYYLSLLLNEWVLGEPAFSFDVHWVFFPSGIRFVLVLLALESGALGIALGVFFGFIKIIPNWAFSLLCSQAVSQDFRHCWPANSASFFWV